MGIESLIRDYPLFHELAKGEFTRWADPSKILSFIDDAHRLPIFLRTLGTYPWRR